MSEKRFIVKSEKIGRFHNIFVQTDKIEYSLTGGFDNDSEMIKEIVDCLNEQQDNINELEQENADLLGDKIRSLDEFEKCTDLLKKKILEQQATIEQLQRKCFELEKDYLIETSDISDKIYLEDEINELKKEYGVDDE